MAIANDKDCEPADEELGTAGDCGSYYPGVMYIIVYLVFSFLVIVNMYIAVILENYTQVCLFFVLGLRDQCLKAGPRLGKGWGHRGYILKPLEQLFSSSCW